MGRLLYVATASLDGYIADANGSFEFAMPDRAVHGSVNEVMRPVGTFLFGRAMYEVMSVWDTFPLAGEPPEVVEFAREWRGADKVVYSTTLDAVTTARTRLERMFDPVAVRRLVHDSERDVGIGGPTLAAAAFAAGLVDEVHLYVCPIIVGGGLAAFPPGMREPLDLGGTERFASGVVHLRYHAR